MRFLWFVQRSDRRQQRLRSAGLILVVLALRALLILAPFAAQLMQLR
jgi:hypothetical protein